jgi:hypothetical protein
MDEMSIAERIFASGLQARRKLALLPFEQKIRILVEMQKRAAGMRPDLNRFVWSPDECSGDHVENEHSDAIVGDPEDLVHVDWSSSWKGSGNRK